MTRGGSMRLQIYGPYGFTRESGYPLFSDARESKSPGIYLWCVKLATSYRVAYVGKADVSLKERLAQEVQRSLAGLDGYFDIPSYQQGIRQQIPCPVTQARDQAKQNLDCCLVFLAPVALPSLLEVESGLIR